MPLDNPSAVVTYIELAGGQNHLVTIQDAWEDWDLSAIVPPATKYVLVDICMDDGEEPGGARKKGSTLDRKAQFGPIATTTTGRVHGYLITEVDDAQKIQIYGGHTSHPWFNILGYWL